MTKLLDVSDITVKVDDKILLSDTSFQLQQGDYLCVLGPNGAGKSTLLKTLMGIIKPTAGTIFLNQQSLSQLSQKHLAQQLSYVPQAHGRQLHFTVADFIKMGRYAYHTAFSDWLAEDQHAMDQAISITDTEPFLHRQMNTLSGGEVQRVMIAAALCQQTPLLLLDEPTSFLDPHHQVEVHQLIRQLNEQHNITIIEVSHDLNHAGQHSKHILALKQGKTLWYGDSSDLLQASHLHDLYGQQFVFTNHPQTGAVVALPSESP
ncbi:MAG: ABC transporter ATP-binding protein [Gammaproteobacteria bacterium]|nr:MAG: ABC transporter ATP-binding protein [Gammaproteobacteria bacterium]RLA00069.1 MAG: ABC transporter ATP-binding protein [Gammaproteobacteria bacterium]